MLLYAYEHYPYFCTPLQFALISFVMISSTFPYIHDAAPLPRGQSFGLPDVVPESKATAPITSDAQIATADNGVVGASQGVETEADDRTRIEESHIKEQPEVMNCFLILTY